MLKCSGDTREGETVTPSFSRAYHMTWRYPLYSVPLLPLLGARSVTSENQRISYVRRTPIRTRYVRRSAEWTGPLGRAMSLRDSRSPMSQKPAP